MKRWCFVAVIVALVVFGSVASASEPKTIPNWDILRQDMALFNGALKGTVGYTVLSTYLPGYGVVFMVEASGDLEKVQREIERALIFITPTISSLPEGESIAIVAWRDVYYWELMYISKANTSSDPKTWDIFYNKLAR